MTTRHDWIEHVGTAPAIRNYGIDVPAPMGMLPESEAITVRGSDGQGWQVWSNDGVFVHARRPRTPEEHVAWIDKCNARVVLDYFSKDRVEIVHAIALRLSDLSWDLQGDAATPREMRRRLRRELRTLARVQMRLTANAAVDMRRTREELASVGLRIEQPDYMGRWEPAEAA